MNRRGRRWLWAAAVLWAVAGQAAPDPLVLRMFDAFHSASELGLATNAATCAELEPLVKAVIGPLFADYAARNDLAVGEADLKEYCRRLAPAADDATFADAWEQWKPGGGQWRLRQQAAAELALWKLQKSLYERYGGRVVCVAGAPPQAFDAMCAYVAEREQAGDFTIHDARLKIRFWECLRAPKCPPLAGAEARALIAEHPAERRASRAAPAP